MTRSRSTFPLVLAFAGLLGSIPMSAACIDGKPDPKVITAIAGEVASAACTFIPVLSGNQVAGVVCKDILDVVQGVASIFAKRLASPAACALVPLGAPGRPVEYVCGGIRDDVLAALTKRGGAGAAK